jgi:DNA repair exonuclease SbcCD ATPase subunit
MKKQEVKEEQREIREQMREEERAQREFEKAEREAAAEQERAEKALAAARAELEKASGEHLEAIELKITDLEQKIADAQAKQDHAVSMAQVTKMGHVYVISNLGSFGEDVFKIGMTRRLEHFHVRCIVIPGETLRQTDDGEIVWRRSASQVA